MSREGVSESGEAFRVKLVETRRGPHGAVSRTSYLGSYRTLGAARGVATSKRVTEEDVDRVAERVRRYGGGDLLTRLTVETTVERSSTAWEEVPDS